MTLIELIEALEAVPDKTKRRVRRGFSGPHSYRGYYDRLAFEPTPNVTVQSMLDCAKQALGATFEGYKGGQYVMTKYTSVYLARHSECGDELGQLLLSYMLEDFIYSDERHGPQTKNELWRYLSSYIEDDGLHSALTDQTSPETSNCDQLDPELAKMWREYRALCERIEEHVGLGS